MAYKYSGILFSLKKEKENLTHSAVMLNLEDSVRSDSSQSQNDKYSVIPLL